MTKLNLCLITSLLIALLSVTALYAHDTGWKPQGSFEYKSSVIKRNLGVTFIHATDEYGRPEGWWYCVTGRCYRLPGEIL